jgi:hypothetical protein
MTPGIASLAELFADTPEELRRQALSHSSWVERRTESYGRLAFLGDSVLGLSVASLLYENHPDADIGELTKILTGSLAFRRCSPTRFQTTTRGFRWRRCSPPSVRWPPSARR